MTSAVSLQGIGKKYRISPSRSSILRDMLSPGKAKRSHEFWALQDVNLDVEPGTTLGILGRNGAGKSTLLSIICGVLRPTTGEVEVNGRLAAIFGLGAGFNPEFTGRENVMLNGLILGIDHQEMLDRFDDIEAFADIGEFIDQPVRTYSGGMRARLGFAVAINVEPDILVLDEALSAGDAAFKKKALQRMYELRDSGTTVLFVSHSMGMVKRFCTEAVLLHKGHIVAAGEPEDVVEEYRAVLDNSQETKDTKTSARDRQLDYTISHEDEEDMPDPPNGARGARRRGRKPTGEAEVLRVELLDESGEPVDAMPCGSSMTVRVRARYAQAVQQSTLGVALRDESGTLLFSTSTDLENVPLGERAEGDVVTVDFTFGVPLRPGMYGVEATVSTKRRLLGRSEEPANFEVVQEERRVRGLIQLPTKIEVHDRDLEEQGPAN